MAKIPFDIKYRSQIESGEYKVETRNGKPARIMCWDKVDNCGQYIVALVQYTPEHENIISVCEDGIYLGSYGHDYDLFLITPEPELTDFEKALKDIVNARDPKNPMTTEGARNNATLLLELAKKEVLKDLPRWKKWGNGACGNGIGIPIAIVKQEPNDYQLVDALGIEGEKYIMLDDLKKLPGFKEE